MVASSVIDILDEMFESFFASITIPPPRVWFKQTNNSRFEPNIDNRIQFLTVILNLRGNPRIFALFCTREANPSESESTATATVQLSAISYGMQVS